MTKSDARKISSAYSNGFQYPFGGGFVEKCDMDEVNRTAELLDKAINKQIPQKPILVDSHKNRLSLLPLLYECPACHCNFTGAGFASYCYHCGQALDWGKLPNDER